MKLRFLILPSFLFLTGFMNVNSSVLPQNPLNQESILPDSSVSVPYDYDNTLDNLLHTWFVQYADDSDCVTEEFNEVISDSVYKVRLSKMPCIMEMPFNNFVKSFIELYTVRKRRQMEYMLGMSDYYFPIFEQILSANNLPLELKYLPIIESALNTTALSRMGAAGLWQFMVGTGKMYGLEINSLVDERLDPIKSTHAAARFLKDLFSIYGDWHMVIAAYNCGPGNVNKAIRRSGGKRDYWAIYPYLPAETRGYVPIFIAANYSMYYASHHKICKAKVKMPALTDTIVVRERIHFEQISAVLNIPVDEIRLLNPQYRKNFIPGDIKPYALCLPLASANNFIERYAEITSYKADSLINTRRSEVEIVQTPVTPGSSGSSHRITYHTVRRGQTLSQIAARYGVSVSKLKSWNNIRGSKIQAGKKLKIMK